MILKEQHLSSVINLNGKILALACTAVVSGNCFAASATIVRNYQYGLCANPATASSGALVQTATCTATPAQMWSAEYVDKGGFGTTGLAYFRLKNQQSGLCLDLQTASTANGMKLVQTACSASTIQQWDAPDIANTAAPYAAGKSYQVYQTFVNRFSGKCLDEPSSGPLQVYACGSGDNQRWFIAD